METVLFYYLSKIFWLVVHPVNLAFLLFLAATVTIFLQRRGLALLFAVPALVLLGLASLTNTGELMLQPLEARYDQPSPPPEEIAGIIVLGGALDLVVSAARGSAELGDAGDRYTETLALAQRYPDVPVVITGGVGSLSGRGEREADAAARFLVELGIDRSRLVLEAQSRTTHENALYTRDLVDPSPTAPWLLVTSAFHMPRSVGVFESAGYNVLPWPTDFKTTGSGSFIIDLENSAGNINKFATGLHEWIGLAAYYMTGRTARLLP